MSFCLIYYIEIRHLVHQATRRHKKMEFRIASMASTLFNPRSQPSTAGNKETYASDTYSDSPGLTSFTPLAVVFLIAEIVFYVILGSAAAYLSWTSNSSIGWHPIFCVIFALIAFVCSASYLTSHVLFKLDLLSALSALKVVQKAAAVVVQAPRNSNASR